MTDTHTPGLAAGRLPEDRLAENFADLHPPLDAHEAAVAADRCYFCHDAPCVTACPTTIDIPLFIRKIATRNADGAGKTILKQNINGGMCARVCPTETLCEEACVRETAEGKPVEIGRLQRFATDRVMSHNGHPFDRAGTTGKSVGVIGTGPAGLACAHRLAMKGHDVVIYDARDKPGGLNEYGIAAYKTVDGYAQAEVDWLLGVGGINIETGATLGVEISLEQLRQKHDAVFLGIGLAGVNALATELHASGGLDALVLTPGAIRRGRAETLEVSALTDLWRDNVEGPWRVWSALRPALRARRGSVVGFTCVDLEGLKAKRHIAAYAAAKSAWLVLLRSAAQEEAAHGVRLNAIAPGWIAHPGAESATRDFDPARVPLGRLGTPEDVARAAVWLCSPEAAYVTGAQLDVAGGFGL